MSLHKKCDDSTKQHKSGKEGTFFFWPGGALWMIGQRYLSPLFGIVEVTADPGMATDIGVFSPENMTPALTHIAYDAGG